MQNVSASFLLDWSLICVSAVTEMVQLEQTSPCHRTSSRDSDDMGEVTPTQVKACIKELFKTLSRFNSAELISALWGCI